VLLLSRLFVVLLAGGAVTAASATAAPVRPGPAGAAFYRAPARLIPGAHGSVLWARRLAGPAMLRGARANELLLYRSRNEDGRPVAVSGTVAIPRGRAPKGGWPVVSWGHATVGLADRCAPTRSDVLGGYDRPLLRRWLRAGFAVARSDYVGLGTPGLHPDLVGLDEAHAVLDVVRAARELRPGLVGRRVALAGHSVGGHAALWATSRAPRYTPELRIRASVAFAPSNDIGGQAAALSALTAPSGDLSAVAAVIARGAEAAYPDLHVARLLSDLGRRLYPTVDALCEPRLVAGPFAGVAPAGLFAPDADLRPLVTRLSANDPDHLRFRTPVRIEQGAADAVVFPSLTDALVRTYRARGLPVTYRRYPGIGHFPLMGAAADDATAFLARRLAP
jgi:alpha-beta hydrolase superfamily lysophospholipase